MAFRKKKIGRKREGKRKVKMERVEERRGKVK